MILIYISAINILYLVISPLSWDWSFIQLLLSLAIFIRYRNLYPKNIIRKYQLYFIFGLLPLFVPNNIELITNIFESLPNAFIFRIIFYLIINFISSWPLLFLYFQIKVKIATLDTKPLRSYNPDNG